MIGFFHKEMAAGRWFALSLCEQLGNVGSEIGRAANRYREGNSEQMIKASERGLELLDLTIEDSRWAGARRKELCRARELVKDVFYGDNEYGDSPEALEKYFFQFALAARRNN